LIKPRSPLLIFVAVLAILQAALGVFRAFEWFDVGADLLGQGILLLPFVGLIAFARGALVISVALAYVLFAVGLLWGRQWAWWVGLFVAAINVLLVVSVIINDESVAGAGLWLIAPVVIAAYLLSASGRGAFKQVNS
jgi:hypothetical protein